ncbi:MAG: hypothetical protein EXQ79_09200 [Acidimicrobiia bacterium]|nr:hypothetical protein [Acidimicrobiia bacterium]
MRRVRVVWGLVATMVLVLGTGSTVAGARTLGGATGSGEYTPVSDVVQEAHIGLDIKAIGVELDKAADGGSIDWAVVARYFDDGGNSRRGDGSFRTLQSRADAADDVAFVQSAIDGTGANASASDALRAEAVDAGISVLLASMMINELQEGRDKLSSGETEPAEGAPHQVDEVWAWFTADGFGLTATGDELAADFDREGDVTEPILEALTAAQTAGAAGDLEGYDRAVDDALAGINLTFYLATYKYLDYDGDPEVRARGVTLYRGIEAAIAAVSPSRATKIADAFESGKKKAGRAALNKRPVLAALGLTKADAEK